MGFSKSYRYKGKEIHSGMSVLLFPDDANDLFST